MRATRIEDRTTGATVHPDRGYEGRETGNQPVCEGDVRVVIPSVEILKRRWGEGWRQNTYSVLNLKVRTPDKDPSGNTIYKNVELRGAPDISGTIYEDDSIQAFGEMSEDGVVRATRIEKPGGSVRPVRMHDPRSRLVRTLLRLGAIALLAMFVLFMIFIIVGFFGFWDFMVQLGFFGAIT
jgi:hypothetical protein